MTTNASSSTSGLRRGRWPQPPAWLHETWLTLRRENFPRILTAMTLVLVGSAVALFLVESEADDRLVHSVGDGLWWALVTMATVGYGDIVPKTTGGRIVGGIVILAGLVLSSLFTATIASVLVAEKIKEGRGLDKVTVRNHVLVCGWNLHGERVVEGLMAFAEGRRPDVVLINELPEEAIADILYRFREQRVKYVRGDPASEVALTRANVEWARSAIVLSDASRGTAARSDERTLLTALAIKGLKPQIRVCAEIADPANAQHLRWAGVDDIVVSGEFNGFLLSSAAVTPGIPQVARELLTFGRSELRRVPIPTEFVGKQYGELFTHLRQKEGATLVGLVTEAKGLKLDDILTDDTSLIDAFIKQQFHDAGKEYLTLGTEQLQVRVNPPDDQEIRKEDSAIVIAMRGSS